MVKQMNPTGSRQLSMTSQVCYCINTFSYSYVCQSMVGRILGFSVE